MAPHLTCLAVYGGSNYTSQINALQGKVDIVCATPGRLNDLESKKYFVINKFYDSCMFVYYFFNYSIIINREPIALSSFV